ncbi:hypothetical protein ACS386_07695 [Flavobacteriaceae bacterium LMO-SS05]
MIKLVSMRYVLTTICSSMMMFTTCANEPSVNDDSVIDRYIVFFLTNTSIDQAVNKNTGKDANSSYNFISELPHLFGEIKKDSKFKYAFGLPGPMLLTQSVDEMQDQINKAFDAAEKYNVPVYFQLDDCNNYTDQFGDGSDIKFYENPDWVEWVSFPKDGENWGGQQNGRPPYFWFNWGSWMHAKAFPAFQSPGYRDFIVNRLREGVLKPLNIRYNKLKAEGRAYLFAGMAIGWETHIPDYSSSNSVLQVNPDNLPISVINGDRMEPWEATKFGYNSLHILGHDQYDLDVLNRVIHDYSELLAKTAFESGIPKHKIFTHIVGMMSAYPDLRTTFSPPIWTAVNEYSVPGFTMSPVTCAYNIETLTAEIKKADPTQNYFALAEGYSLGVDQNFKQADDYFASMFNNNALFVSVFGWGREPPASMFSVSHSEDSPFVLAAKKWLEK